MSFSDDQRKRAGERAELVTQNRLLPPLLIFICKFEAWAAKSFLRVLIVLENWCPNSKIRIVVKLMHIRPLLSYLFFYPRESSDKTRLKAAIGIFVWPNARFVVNF